MAGELTYLMVTPESLRKGRTGLILARVLSNPELKLVGARVMAFDNAGAKQFAAMQKLPEMAGWVEQSLSPLADGKKQSFLILLLEGEAAIAQVAGECGELPGIGGGDKPTLRGTFAQWVKQGGVTLYLDPAVIFPADKEEAASQLKEIAAAADVQSNIVENASGVAENAELSLVILKPDNWRRASCRPGCVFDYLDRTGLQLVGCKVYHMSVAQALEFYGPVKDALRSKLAPKIAGKVKEQLEADWKWSLPDGDLTGALGVAFADHEFGSIVEFMSGRRPETCPEAELSAPGLAQTMVLIFAGNNAITKVRQVLGATDPEKALPGTIRRDFATNVMVNTTHASDAPESVVRESKVLQIEKNTFSDVIRAYY